MKPKTRTLRFWSCDLVGRLRKTAPMAVREKPGHPSLLSRLVCALFVAIMLISCILTTPIVQDATSTPAPDQGAVVPVSSPPLPAPPAPLAVSLQNPEESARTLADALAGPDKLAAWLGLYQALGIPVIGEDRKALDGSDDPIGPGYWQVWYSAGLDLPGRGIRLSDAGRLLGFVFELKPEDSQSLGDTLLSDLRSALQSDDAAVHLLGAVARERILRSGLQLDISDSATTAQAASIDIPMVQLLFWVALRAELAHVPTQSSALPGGASLIAYNPNPVAQDVEPWNCSTALGGKDSTYWVNWLINKGIGGGIQLPGMDQALPGMVAMALNVGNASKGLKSAVLNRVSQANVLARAISLLMQLASMDLASIQNPDKLERTKTTLDGKQSTITWRLMSDPGKLPSGNELRQCVISLFTSTLGVKLTFPKDGRIPGAELDFDPGKNIPTRVRFAESDYRRRWTNQNGEAELLMLGRAQKKDLPDTATTVEAEYSVFVSAQPEEAGLNSMLNIFFSGLVAGSGLAAGAAPSPARAINALIDILKAFTYDMGEYVFPMVDWKQPGYRVVEYSGNPRIITGVVCSLEEPFTIDMEIDDGFGMIRFPIKFKPAFSSASWDVTKVGYPVAESGFTAHWFAVGTYSVDGIGTDKVTITWRQTQSTMDLTNPDPYVPKIPTTNLSLQPKAFDLVPLDTDECNKP